MKELKQQANIIMAFGIIYVLITITGTSLIIWKTTGSILCSVIVGILSLVTVCGGMMIGVKLWTDD